MPQKYHRKNAGARAPQDGAKEIRLADIAAPWLAERRENVKESTYIKYEAIWRLHIAPALGQQCVLTVTTPVIDAFRRALLREGLAPKTARDVLVELGSILAYAAQYEGVELAAAKVHYPREARKPMRVLSLEEQQRLVTFLSRETDCCKFGVLLALLTGIRLGEVCALRWQNISLSEGVIIIDATMQRLKTLDDSAGARTHVVVTSPKTSAAARVIPMSDTVAALCRAMTPRPPACYVLTGTEKYMEPRRVQYRMKEYALACGLDGVHFHTLRHTFATRSVEVGFEIKSLSEILGHANTSITLDRYVHSSLALKRNNMNKLAQVGL